MLTTPQEAGASLENDLLREDHKKVTGLFEDFDQAGDAKAKQRIIEEALAELDAHAKREEEIQDDDLIEEALDDYHVVHILIGELQKMKTRGDCSDDIDWEALSSRVEKRKEQLMATSGATSKNGQDKATKNR